MADKTKLSEWVKWPAAILGAITAVAILLGAFGFGFSTPGDAWDEHNVEHVILSDTIREIDAHLHVQQELIEALVRGECIENPLEDLQRQGLSQKCSDLGIER